MTTGTVAQACLDEEITKYMMKVSALRTQRNALSLIGRLPAETLAAIFIHRASDYYSKYSGRATPKPPLWINVSYVCRHWRYVALNCPNLWVHLFITSPRWTEALLARSKQASLRVHVSSRSTNRQKLSFMAQVMVHVERIQEISLDLDMKDDIKFIHQLSSRAPRLQNLKIGTRVVSSTSELPTVLFDGYTPALRTLELHSCPVPWFSFKLNGLITLNLKNVPKQLQQNMGEFLATLRSAQNLAHLYLDRALSGAIDFFAGTASHHLQKINLPHLSCLLIVTPLLTVTALLSCMEFPSETELRLECTESSPAVSFSDHSLDEYSMLSSLLGQRFTTSMDQVLPGAVIRSLVVDLTYTSMRLTFSASKRDDNSFESISEEWGFNIPLRIIIYLGRSTVDDLFRITSDICCSMPLAHVQSFHVIKPPTSHDFWRKTIRHLPSLRYIKLSNGVMPDLASILSMSNLTISGDMENQDGNTDRGLDGILVPALEELELEDIFFSSTPDGFTCCATDTQSQSLCDALSARKYIQGQITMTQCHLCDSWHTCFNLVGRWEGGCFRIVTVKVGGS